MSHHVHGTSGDAGLSSTQGVQLFDASANVSPGSDVATCCDLGATLPRLSRVLLAHQCRTRTERAPWTQADRGCGNECGGMSTDLARQAETLHAQMQIA